ncbi:hypothetical protein [Oceanobacillus indicireducens]|uniref:Uncharacterized protein n=1 Tax=Oceanobacillus indicireducens TaxID=1004261 RepID=A0A917Y2P2_9BACI|nr:hypothetical protein [Oceanobacillus indicireducens]GGN64351.1 hypothetical protein GCM10007971_32140 [Oceanobacillus indicireducens]
MSNLEKLQSEERHLKNELENSLRLAAYEERRLVDAKGYDKEVSEKMRKSFYDDASEFRKDLHVIQKEIKKLNK